ncbi:MAG: hypothetical protein Kow00109_14680 [Acidobacteriota bacterium]
MGSFLWIGLPYVAILTFVVGALLRARFYPLSVSSFSAQFLESRRLRWGSAAFHWGVLTVLLGHLAAFLFPETWQALTASRGFLQVVEFVGLVAALICLVGVGVLLVRRLTDRLLQPVTDGMDLAVLLLLLLQILVGVLVAVHHRWGAAWAPGTLTPYLWSLLTLRPDSSFVEEMPPLVQVHLVGAWLLLLITPFSRLMHVFSVPLGYLVRAPQRVLWATVRFAEKRAPELAVVEARRELVKGLAAVGGAVTLLSIGVATKLFAFFRGPDLTAEEELSLLQTRIKRLETTRRERELQLERMQKRFIPVAPLQELSPTEGKYFIDYQMRPALAFRDADGWPLLISAKCTHLGCTISSSVDPQGRLLCPCHISYFDLETGRPNPGSPAKEPLPLLGWVLMNDAGEVVARRLPGGEPESELSPEELANTTVYIVKDFEEVSA